MARIKPTPESGLRLLAIVVASSIALLVDGTANFAISTGLPYIQGLVGTTPDESSWILTLFNAPYYSAILLSPWLYARFGRKRLLIASMLGFIVSSFALSLSTSFVPTLALRFVQGASLGCVFVPAGLLLFTSLPLNALALGIPWFALLALGGSALGTLLGGYLSETFGASALYIPSAIAMLLAVGLVYSQAPDVDTPQPDLRLDIVGIAFSLACFSAMQYLANEGERRNWLDTAVVLPVFIVWITSASALIVWELYVARTPHANFHLFGQYRNLAVGAAVNVVLGAIGYSVALFSAYLQSSIAATATLAGATIALRLITYVIGIAVAFLLVSRRIVDVRIVVGVSAVASTVCLLALAWQMTTTAEAASFVVVSLAFGLCFSMMSQPVPSLVVGSLPLELLPAGLSIYKLSGPIGLMFATAAVQTTVDHSATAHSSDIAGFVNTREPAVRHFFEHGGSLLHLAQTTGEQAQVLAFHDAMILLALATLLVIPPLAFTSVARRGT